MGAVDGLEQLSWRSLDCLPRLFVSTVMLMSHRVAFSMTTLTAVTVKDAEGHESVCDEVAMRAALSYRGTVGFSYGYEVVVDSGTVLSLIHVSLH